MNKLYIILPILFLVGCKTPTIDFVPKTTLELTQPETLVLDDIQFDVKKENDEIFYILDAKNFNSFVFNQEQLQNRIILNERIIREYKNYYENRLNE
jgi:hypothetical protein